MLFLKLAKLVLEAFLVEKFCSDLARIKGWDWYGPKNVLAWEFLIWSRDHNSSAGTGAKVSSQLVLEMETFLASRQSTRNRQSWWERKQVGSGLKTRLVVELAARRFWFRFEILLPCLMMCISIRGLEYGPLSVILPKRILLEKETWGCVVFNIPDCIHTNLIKNSPNEFYQEIFILMIKDIPETITPLHKARSANLRTTCHSWWFTLALSAFFTLIVASSLFPGSHMRFSGSKSYDNAFRISLSIGVVCRAQKETRRRRRNKHLDHHLWPGVMPGDVSLLSDCCHNARDLKSLKPSPALLPYLSFNGYLSPKGMCSLDWLEIDLWFQSFCEVDWRIEFERNVRGISRRDG